VLSSGRDDSLEARDKCSLSRARKQAGRSSPHILNRVSAGVTSRSLAEEICKVYRGAAEKMPM
jgi:hypothetical protein